MDHEIRKVELLFRVIIEGLGISLVPSTSPTSVINSWLIVYGPSVLEVAGGCGRLREIGCGRLREVEAEVTGGSNLELNAFNHKVQLAGPSDAFPD